MCFSATASFAVAGATAVTGLAVLRQVTQPRELALAIVPLLFAAQQAVEGALWLQLTGAANIGSVETLAAAFLLFAYVLWPLYTPLAALLIEPERGRRRVMAVIAAMGAVLSLVLLMDLVTNPPGAAVNGHSIDYTGESDPLAWQQIPYLVATGVPLLLSSFPLVRIFGAVVLGGFVVSAYVHAETFVSVWCFFAAADSTLLYFHFRRVALAAGLARR